MFFLLALTVCVPLVGPFNLDSYRTPKLALIETGAVVLAALKLRRWRPGCPCVPLMVSAPAAVFLFAACVSLLAAPNPHRGLETVFAYACYFVIMLLVAHEVRTTRDRFLVAAGIALSGGIVALGGVLQYIGVWRLYDPWSRPVSTIGNVTFVAEYYDVALPVALGYVIAAKNWRKRVGIFAAVILMLSHSLVLGSRGGWMGLLAATLVFVCVGLFPEWRARGRRYWGYPAVLLIGGLMLTIALLTVKRPHLPRPLRHITDRLTLNDPSTKQRIYLWRDTARMAFDHPFVGVGAGNFEYVFPEYASQKSFNIKRWMQDRHEGDLMHFRVHNEYLEILVETGVVGLAAFSVLVGSILWRGMQSVRNGEGGSIAVGLFAGAIATVLHALVSSNFQDPASALGFWLAGGLIIGQGFKKGEARIQSSGRPGWYRTALGIGATVAVVVIWSERVLGAYHYQQGLAAIKRKRDSEARQHLDRAVHFATLERFKTYQLLGSVLYRQGDWGAAVKAFEKSLQYHPNSPTVLHYLGLSLGHLGRLDEAIRPLRRAVGLNPRFSEYRLSLGEALGVSGNPDEAVEQLNQGLLFDPSSPVAFYKALGVNHRRAGNYRAAERALGRALGAKPDDPILLNSLAVALIEQAKFQAAQDILRGLVERHPVDLNYRMNLAVVLLNLGKLEAARTQCRKILEIAPDERKARELLDLVSSM